VLFRSLEKLLFLQSEEAVQVYCIFLDVRVDMEGQGRPFFGQGKIGGKGDLHAIADTLHVEYHGIRRFQCYFAAQHGNHRYTLLFTGGVEAARFFIPAELA